MAQVSYGTITITDTNDIERIYTVYAKSANNTTLPDAAAADWKELISEAPGTGNYIWQRTVVQKSGTQEKTYSDPVCLTGEEGTDGRGITSITIKYGTSADWNTQPSNWYDNTPEYSSSTPNYWTQTTISYTSGNPTVKVTQDKALTQAIYDSIVANSLAQSANENANGAMGQAASNVNEVKRIWYAQAAATPVPAAPTTGITTSATHDAWSITKPAADDSYQYYFYCDQTKTGGGVYSWSEVILDTSALSQYQIGAMSAKVRNYWWDSAGAHIASGITSSSGEVTKDTVTSEYGYNTLTALTGISFRYNQAKVVDLNSTTPSLDFYTPPTISADRKTATEGKKTMMLSANALTFYDPTDGQTERAVLNTNGLVLKKGGIKAGNYSTSPNKFIYLSTEDYNSSPTITINGNSSGWRQIIGTKFGVKNDGTLYANNAVISGTITVGSGSDLSAGLGDYSTTSETQSYVTGLGYQTSNDVNTIIGQTNVSDLSDGSDYTKTANLGSTTAVQNAAKTASNYLGDTDSNAGVTLKAQNGTTTANTNTSNYIKINTNGLEVFKAGISVALYGDTARIGKTNSSRFLLNADSLQAYNSSNTKYFEVSPTSLTYGVYTAASTTYADGKASAAETNAKTAAQGYADAAEANASYSVEIQVTSIDYAKNSATLVAIPYYQGSTTMPDGVTLSYKWYKNGSVLENTSTAPTIAGATTNTLQLGEGTDFGSSTTNAIYTCVIS